MATRYLNFDAATNGAGTLASPWNDFDTAQDGVARGDTVIVSGYLGGSMVFNPAKGGISPAAKTKWLGTVDNPFVVSGGQRLTGWVQCTAGDSADVGANFASIWKTTLTKSSFVNSDPYGANICENNVQLPICTSRADTSDKFFLTKPQYYHTATSVVTTGTGTATQLVAFRLPAVTDLYTKVQLERGRLQWVSEPNVSLDSRFTFDATTKNMTLTTPDRYENSTVKDNFAIANLLPTLKRGEWGFIDNGTTATMYIWPQNVASLANGIEYSARDVGISINGTSNLEIAYFKTRQCVGNINASGNLFNFGPRCSDVYLHNFESTDSYNLGGMQAPVYISGVNNCEVAYFDVRRAQRSFGIFTQGEGSNAYQAGGPVSGLAHASGGYVHHYTVAFASSAAHRLFIVKDHINAFGIFWECAKQSHGNTLNAYQSSHNHLWWGIDGEDSDGYYTWQQADSIIMLFCSASASRGPNAGARGITHQQGVHRNMGEIYGYKPSGVINCSTTPNALDGRLSFQNSLVVGASEVPNDRAYVYNTVHHGNGTPTAPGYAADAATLLDFDHNVTTAGVARGANDVLTTLAATYVNAAGDDFRYTPTSIVRTKPGKDLTAIIAALQTRFPKFTDWDKDMVGDTFNAAAPGMGPTVNKDAPRGQARNITYAGIVGGSDGGGGGEPTRPVFSPGFKIKVA